MAAGGAVGGGLGARPGPRRPRRARPAGVRRATGCRGRPPAPGGPRRVVEPAAQQVGVGGGLREPAHGGQRRGRRHRPPGRSRTTSATVRSASASASGAVHCGSTWRDQPAQHAVEDDRVGLGGEVPPHDAEVVADGRVAGPHPGRGVGPGDRAQQRVGERREPVDGRLPRQVVEQHRGVRLVRGVGDHRQRRRRPAARPAPSSRSTIRVSTPDAAVQADHAEPVRPRALAREHRDVAVAGHPDRVEAGGAQVGLRPAAHVAVGDRVERLEVVGQLGVAEPVPGQVDVRALDEGVPAEPDHQLVQHRRALGVGDHVEVGERGVDVDEVLGVLGDRVGRAPPVGDVRRSACG